MTVAVLSLLGFLLATYLWLWKIGALGSLACGTGACETVQMSDYAVILGVPVALFGVVGYLALFVASLVGLQPRWVTDRRPTIWITGLSVVGVAFTLYLTYLEAAVIEAWCRWCLVSAGLIGLICVAGLGGFRELRSDAVQPE